MFMRVDTPHGPIEVAVGFNPRGAIAQVVVTKGTVESKAWLLEAVRSRALDGYAGLTPAAVEAQNLTHAPALPGGMGTYRGKVGRMAAYMLEQIGKGVGRALVAYGWFYRP
ncbi:MAG: hypothetical protein ACREMW_09250 [Gemmatimonadales bacterium]